VGRGGASSRGKTEVKTGPSTGWLKLESVAVDQSSPLIARSKATADSADSRPDEIGVAYHQDGPGKTE